jgi:hypothetical protein
MKIGIVIPLKAKVISKNWQQVCQSLQQTVGSVLNQKSKEYRVAVVGHDCPSFLNGVKDCQENIFVPFNELEPPITNADEPANQMKYETDRCSKILKGIMTLKQRDEEITHWFALDADDLIRDTFVSSLIQRPECEGFLIKHGYFYFQQKGIFNKTNKFYIYCGSSAVIADKFFNLPSKIKGESFRSIPFGDVSHVHMDIYFDSMNIAYNTPKTPLLMYVRDHGDNISDGYITSIFMRVKQLIGLILRTRILSSQTKRSFGLK